MRLHPALPKLIQVVALLLWAQLMIWLGVKKL